MNLCSILACLAPVAASIAWQAPGPHALTQHQTVRLWTGAAPASLGVAPEDIPTLTAYLPADKTRTGSAVIVCPGGGYGVLADHEGRPVAEWLNSLGVTAFVLRYRLGPHYHHPVELGDAQRAIRVVRANAAAWDVDPLRIGILGFSAGGHLASSAATHFDAGVQASEDPVERESSRPDLAILLYPVITMSDPFTHAGSRQNLLGEHPAAQLIEKLSNEKQVTPQTPPTFLMHTADDEAVSVENSLLFASALRSAGVPFELHVFQHGAHGVGLAVGDPILGAWPALCGEWLVSHGFARQKEPSGAKRSARPISGGK